MSKVTTLEERIQIMEWAQAGWKDQPIAQELGWTPRTVRKWRRRGQQQGRAGMASAMGRPARGTLSSFPAQLRETIRQWRQTHPGWGAQTLYHELNTQPEFAGQKLPRPASIGRFLHEQGLTRAYERHSALPVADRRPAGQPHDVWEMDARGHEYVPEVGVITLINLNDRASHLRLLSYPCQVGRRRWQRHPDTEDYQLTLRLAFADWGLPRRLQVDRASVFVDTQSKSPFPTRLQLWLLALGVALDFGRPGQPRDQAMSERSHQLWAAQCLWGQSYPAWQALYLALRTRRDFLNVELPCAALHGQAPLQAFPTAQHSGRPYRPEWEADLLDLQPVYDYLAQGHWFRLASKDGTFSLGGHVYYLGKPWAHQQLELSFDSHDQHVICCDQAGHFIKRLPIQGIDPSTLMGLLAVHFNLPYFQLALPFDWETIQVTRLFETLVSRLNEH